MLCLLFCRTIVTALGQALSTREKIDCVILTRFVE